MNNFFIKMMLIIKIINKIITLISISTRKIIIKKIMQMTHFGNLHIKALIKNIFMMINLKNLVFNRKNGNKKRIVASK